jgi:hypothetical protein
MLKAAVAAVLDAAQYRCSMRSMLVPFAIGNLPAQLNGSVVVHITHTKPGKMEAVMAEIGRLGTPHRVRALEAEQVIEVG